VLVHFDLGQDGALIALPKIMNRGSSALFQIAAESAVRAVQTCAPFKFLPAAKYDAWKEIEINFDPREMFRG
jgi:colicin import membrane protein